MQITVRNAVHALPHMITHIVDNGVEQDSRNGRTLELEGVTAIEYTRPTERQLFCPVRDENPFFNYLEGLWMLAGRNDVEFLSKIVGRMATFSDDGKTFNAAYGYRMRHHFGFDQLLTVIDLLKKDPNTRQAVVQLWDYQDLTKVTKDKACNTQIVFKIRAGKLHMTVFNRSNDLIWGALGANKSHFSMIQEFVAAEVGVPIGSYYQVSNAMHVYTDLPAWNPLVDRYYHEAIKGRIVVDDPYEREVQPYPLVHKPDVFLKEVEAFCEDPLSDREYHNPSLGYVAKPLYKAYALHKAGDTALAIRHLHTGMVQCDYNLAASEWLYRRLAGQYEKRFGHGQDLTDPDTLTH